MADGAAEVTAVLDRIGRALGQPRDPSSDFDLNPGVRLNPDRVLRPAAVLIGILPGRSGPEVLLTRRSARLKHHPGQIALPGGRMEPEDATPEAAALREAEEEVGLDPRLVRLVGRLDPHETVTQFRVEPVVAGIAPGYRAAAQPGEVAEIFTVPVEHVLDPSRYRIEERDWQGVRRRYYTVPWGAYYIWGATARMLKGLADRVAACR